MKTLAILITAIAILMSACTETDGTFHDDNVYPDDLAIDLDAFCYVPDYFICASTTDIWYCWMLGDDSDHGVWVRISVMDYLKKYGTLPDDTYTCSAINDYDDILYVGIYGTYGTWRLSDQLDIDCLSDPCD